MMRREANVVQAELRSPSIQSPKSRITQAMQFRGKPVRQLSTTVRLRTALTQIDNGVGDVIRSAEKHIAEGKYDLALERVSVARELDPTNQYIFAIVDRINALKRSTKQSRRLKENVQTDVDKNSARYLSLTVGAGYTDGIKPIEDNSSLNSGDARHRVEEFIRNAEGFLQAGYYQNAFDSLMNAYFLDPTHPAVIACERVILPIWELASNPEPSVRPDNGDALRRALSILKLSLGS